MATLSYFSDWCRKLSYYSNQANKFGMNIIPMMVELIKNSAFFFFVEDSGTQTEPP